MSVDEQICTINKNFIQVLINLKRDEQGGKVVIAHPNLPISLFKPGRKS